MRDRLMLLRVRNKLTQELVAQRVGISRSLYGHIETGTRRPSYGLAKQIADLLGVRVEDIFVNYESFRMKP